jgi:hypothetical protein
VFLGWNFGILDVKIDFFQRRFSIFPQTFYTNFGILHIKTTTKKKKITKKKKNPPTDASIAAPWMRFRSFSWANCTPYRAKLGKNSAKLGQKSCFQHRNGRKMAEIGRKWAEKRHFMVKRRFKHSKKVQKWSEIAFSA